MLRLVILASIIAGAFAEAIPLDMTAAIQKETLDVHNAKRSGVEPKGTNIEKMGWDDDAAGTAKFWAMSCIWGHDGRDARTPESWKDSPGKCGQNLYATAGTEPTMTKAINNWYNEIDHWEYGAGSTTGGTVGHFTQVVWAKSAYVGCAIATCDTGSPFGDFDGGKWYNVVCNYCPTGNYGPTGTNVYAKPYSTSDSCPDGSPDAEGLCPASSGGGKR